MQWLSFNVQLLIDWRISRCTNPVAALMKMKFFINIIFWLRCQMRAMAPSPHPSISPVSPCVFFLVRSDCIGGGMVKYCGLGRPIHTLFLCNRGLWWIMMEPVFPTTGSIALPLRFLNLWLIVFCWIWIIPPPLKHICNSQLMKNEWSKIWCPWSSNGSNR